MYAVVEFVGKEVAVVPLLWLSKHKKTVFGLQKLVISDWKKWYEN